MSSPFAAAEVSGTTARFEAELEHFTGPPVLSTPFAEAFGSYDEHDPEAEAFELLRSEFEDEEFVEGLEALADEAAGRHLVATATWGEDPRASEMATAEVQQWVGAATDRAEALLGDLEAHFADRPVVEPLSGSLETEIESVAGTAWSAQEHEGPLDAQEMFIKALVKKVKKVVKGVGKVVAKGVRAVGKVPLGRLFGFLKKLVRPLLQRVLQKALGKLPPQLQPAARKVAARLGFGPKPAPAGGSPASPAAPAAASPATPPEDPAATPDDPATAPDPSGVSVESFADELDASLAEAVLQPDEVLAEAVLDEAATVAVDQQTGDGAYGDLDVARRRLEVQLLEADPQRPPLAEMEQFVPVVMAAMKILKLGIKVIGRKRVVEALAKLLAGLIQPMVGKPAGLQLSRHIAGAGLGLLGLEAERQADGTLGAEALVATTEDTVREVLSMPAESLESELLLEAAVEEAFTRAARRHFPARVLRPDLADDDRGIWVMYPRRGPRRRYKKYSVVEPVSITLPVARSVFLDGETLEDRLLDAGVRSWPVQGEVHYYETLPGTSLGHLAAFEQPDGASGPAAGAAEFEELEALRPMVAAAPPRDHRPGVSGPRRGARHQPHRRPGRDLPPGTRLARVVVPGVRLRRRSPLRLRLDLSGPGAHVQVSLHLGERVSHELVRDLQQRRPAQVVNRFRVVAGDPLRQVLAVRLARHLARQGVTLPEGARDRLADQLGEAVVRAVAKELPGMAPALDAAAREEAPGMTVTFRFAVADRAALVQGRFTDPKVSVHGGGHRD